jgi:hypothetical protein
MKELSLSVSTGGEGKDNTVVITGKFDTHQEAVLFHAQVAKFCADATRPPNSFGGKLITWRKSTDPEYKV